MKIFGYEFGKKSISQPQVSDDIGDVSVNARDDILKAYIPNFLYKPPFGYPRPDNLPMIRQLAKNPYIYSVVKTLCDEAASTDYDVVYKDDTKPTPALDEIRKNILKFLDNPNKNKESFSYLVRAAIKDICEVDAGVWIKVFNEANEFSQMFARDGASILMNPDIYGYLGNRSEYIAPMNINYAVTPDNPDYSATIHNYTLTFKDSAAYFQYGTTAMALPVPFGRREVVYMKANPQSNSIYGLSPIQILADIIVTLVYGSNYNLDFYMNNNMPEGIIQLLGANGDQVTAFRERFDKQFRATDPGTGFMRKVGFKIPIVNQEAKFTPFQLDPGVMQIVEQQTWFTKLVWTCFGVTPDEMGFTENSNKAVSQTQGAVHKRKALRPLLNIIKYHIDKEIIAEWGSDAFDNLEFKWDDYDLDEDIKRHTLYQAQLNMGIITPEMIAEDEGIDYAKVQKYNDEQEEKEMNKQEQLMNMGFGGPPPDNSGSKSWGHKYIKRTGAPGNYRYWYKDPKTGKLVDGKQITSQSFSNKVDIDKLIAEKYDNIKAADKKKIAVNNEAFLLGKDTFGLHFKDNEWSNERKPIVKSIMKIYADAIIKAKTDKPKVIFMAGLPAAGKTTATKTMFKEINKEPSMLEDNNGNKFIVLNADDIKKMLPEYDKGLGSQVVHRESSKINEMLVMIAANAKANIVIDGTFSKTHRADNQLKDFKGRGYSSELIFVDTPVHVALERAEKRYLDPNDGRYTPYNLITATAPMMIETINNMKDKFDKYVKVNG